MLINNKDFFLTVLEAEKAEVMVAADSVSGENFLVHGHQSLSSHGRRGKGALWAL